MKTFLIDFGLCLFIPILFTACGWGAISPFRAQVKFPLAASGLAGMLLLSCGSLAIHVVMIVPFKMAALISAISLLTVSAVAGGTKISLPSRELMLVLGALGLLSLLGCSSILYKEIEINSPALVFSSGSDQFGYAHLSDWITDVPRTAALTPDPTDIYASWVDIMLKFDPRFGSISTVAIISTLSGRSGLFSYNLSCAIILITASLGLAGIFAQTVSAFLIVALGAFLSTWYSLSTAGYLGKIAGYPASLFCVGVFFALVRKAKSGELPLPAFLATLAIAICASLMFNGMAVCTLLIVVGGLFLLLDWIFDPHAESSGRVSRFELTAALVALALVALISSGTIARPLYLTEPAFDTSWRDLWIRASQVIGTESELSLFVRDLHPMLASAVGVLWLVLCAIVMRGRQSGALALLLGPAAVAVALSVAGQRWKFYQTISIYVPAALCAVAVATSNRQGRFAMNRAYRGATLTLGAGIIALGLRTFRNKFRIHRWIESLSTFHIFTN